MLWPKVPWTLEGNLAGYLQKDDAEDDSKKTILKRKTVELKPMDEEEAILQMNMLGHTFFVFNDVNTNTKLKIFFIVTTF